MEKNEERTEQCVFSYRVNDQWPANWFYILFYLIFILYFFSVLYTHDLVVYESAGNAVH